MALAFPSGDRGYLPAFLFVSGVTAFYSSIQSYVSLYSSRRMYSGLFVSKGQAKAKAKTSAAGVKEKANENENSMDTLVPVPADQNQDGKAHDQVTPLSSRLFGVYTFVAGLLRIYGAYYIDNPVAYQLALWGYVVAGFHFTSETLVYKTIRVGPYQAVPFLFSYGGMVWMFMQYRHYVSA